MLDGEEYMYEVKVDYDNYKILEVDESKRVGLEYLGSRLVNCWYVNEEVMMKEINELCSNGYEDIDYDVSIDGTSGYLLDWSAFTPPVDITQYALQRCVDLDEA